MGHVRLGFWEWKGIKQHIKLVYAGAHLNAHHSEDTHSHSSPILIQWQVPYIRLQVMPWAHIQSFRVEKISRKSTPLSFQRIDFTSLYQDILFPTYGRCFVWRIGGCAIGLDSNPPVRSDQSQQNCTSISHIPSDAGTMSSRFGTAGTERKVGL